MHGACLGGSAWRVRGAVMTAQDSIVKCQNRYSRFLCIADFFPPVSKELSRFFVNDSFFERDRHDIHEGSVVGVAHTNLSLEPPQPVCVLTITSRLPSVTFRASPNSLNLLCGFLTWLVVVLWILAEVMSLGLYALTRSWDLESNESRSAEPAGGLGSQKASYLLQWV